ncbi:hypothetical protein V8E52_007373 [Russula decolorans]
MRQHKVVARIFLFLSIANFTFAGVANTPTMHEMRVDLVTPAEDVTEASERGHTQSEELPEWLGRPSTAGHLHSRLDPPAQAVDPDENKFFSKELIRKMKEYFILGSIAGTFIGVGNAIQKEDFGTVSPGAQTVGRSVEPLIEHPQDQEDLVSHSLSSMKDHHLQMLSILSRRMLNSLD